MSEKDPKTYGARLKKAREHAALSQAALQEKAAVGTQENISKLERTAAEGSEFTVQYAFACGVNPFWLATGEGEMLDGILVTEPDKMALLKKYDQADTRGKRNIQRAAESESEYVIPGKQQKGKAA